MEEFNYIYIIPPAITNITTSIGMKSNKNSDLIAGAA